MSVYTLHTLFAFEACVFGELEIHFPSALHTDKIGF